MTPTDRARELVLRFQQDGHPYYDELVEMIAQAIQQAVDAERHACAALADRYARIAPTPVSRFNAETLAREIRARGMEDDHVGGAA